jgi:hypothetical protein
MLAIMGTIPAVYLDTNIISGLAKGEFSEEIASACVEITALAKCGLLALYTSKITADELEMIPPQYQAQHFVIYNLIKNVSAAKEITGPSLVTGGMGGGQLVTRGLGKPARPKFIREIDALIPESRNSDRTRARARDISHLFQCQQAGLDYFLTEDHRSILRYKTELRQLGVTVISSVELVRLLRSFSLCSR